MTADTTRRNLRVHLRWLLRRDMLDVVTISATTADPWTEDDILRCLRHRDSIGVVAEADHDARTVGFMLYEMRPQSLRLLTLAVAPTFRGRGVGSVLVAKLVHKVVTHRREQVETVVGERNAAGLAFLRARGFRAVGVVRGWADDEDGYEMRLTPGAV